MRDVMRSGTGPWRNQVDTIMRARVRKKGGNAEEVRNDEGRKVKEAICKRAITCGAQLYAFWVHDGAFDIFRFMRFQFDFSCDQEEPLNLGPQFKHPVLPQMYVEGAYSIC